MFPVNFRDEIEIDHFKPLNVVETQEKLLTKISEKLKAIKMNDIQAQGSKVFFEGGVGLFRSPKTWSLVSQIDQGYIEVISNAKGLSLSFFVSFNRTIAIGTALLLVGGFFVFTKLPMSNTGKILSILGVWLLVVTANWLIARIMFQVLIEDIISDKT